MATPKVTKTSPKKGVSFVALKREAEQRAVARGKPRPKIEPYVIHDVEPPIIINPPDDKRLLVISECIGVDGTFHSSRVMPLLRALAGDQFGRVWMLIPDDDPAAAEIMLALVQSMVDHFMGALRDAMGVAEQPGGSEGSSS